jgi:hypothetical protein
MAHAAEGACSSRISDGPSRHEFWAARPRAAAGDGRHSNSPSRRRHGRVVGHRQRQGEAAPQAGRARLREEVGGKRAGSCARGRLVAQSHRIRPGISGRSRSGGEGLDRPRGPRSSHSGFRPRARGTRHRSGRGSSRHACARPAAPRPRLDVRSGARRRRRPGRHPGVAPAPTLERISLRVAHGRRIDRRGNRIGGAASRGEPRLFERWERRVDGTTAKRHFAACGEGTEIHATAVIVGPGTVRLECWLRTTWWCGRCSRVPAEAFRAGEGSAASDLGCRGHQEWLMV